MVYITVSGMEHTCIFLNNVATQNRLNTVEKSAQTIHYRLVNIENEISRAALLTLKILNRE